MMFHMRRASFLIILCLLTACAGSDSAVLECALEYWDGTVGLCLPQGWSVIDAQTLRQRGVPEETIAGFQADSAVSGQFPTVTVTRELLTAEIAPEVYSNASMRSVSVLPGYQELETTSMEVDGATVSLHVFTAQPVAEEPMRRFYQVSTVAGSTGYTATAAAPVVIDDALDEQIVFVLQHLTFQESDSQQ